MFSRKYYLAFIYKIRSKIMQLKDPGTLSDVLLAKVKEFCVKQSIKLKSQDEAGLYIPPCGSNTQANNYVSDLNGIVNDFTESNKKVMLLLGEAGTGKSCFCEWLIQRKSEFYEPDQPIPLYVYLPTIAKAKLQTELMEEALKKYGFTLDEIETLRLTQNFFVVFDAVDETGCRENLLVENQSEKWNARFLITCRPSYLTQESNYQTMFIPVEDQRPLRSALLEVYISPFLPNQIDQYISQFLTVKSDELRIKIRSNPDLSEEWLKGETYRYWIEKIPGMEDLTKNPFFLRLAMDGLPVVTVGFLKMGEAQKGFEMTAKILHKVFIDQLLARQEARLVAQRKNIGRNYSKECLKYAEVLATKMYERGLNVVHFVEESTVDEIFGVVDDKDKGKVKQKSEWAIFFSKKEGAQDKIDTRIRCMECGLLKKAGEDQWAFIHPSIRDYFAGKSIIGAHKNTLDVRFSQNLMDSEPRAQVGNHRLVGKFFLLNRVTPQEAKELSDSKGIKIEFAPGEQKQKLVFGVGNFGKFRLARNVITNDFAGVKRIRGRDEIRASQQEANCQRELAELPNVMPIWDSHIVKSKKQKDVDILMQFMPLASFGSGEHLFKVLPFVQDEVIKTKFLIHILRSLITGIKGIHNRRIRHLDLKPRNFVMTNRGEVLIIDFGCAVRDYGNKVEPLIRGGAGDTHYFSPERLAVHRKKYIESQRKKGLFLLPNNCELADHYDPEKADMWAIGLTLLELYTENEKCLSGCDNSIEWKYLNWSSEYMNDSLSTIINWDNPPENSLLSVIKLLLRLNHEHRPSAVAVLSHPLFSDQQFKIGEKELLDLMKDLIKWKVEPPETVIVGEKESAHTTELIYAEPKEYLGLGDAIDINAFAGHEETASIYLNTSDEEESTTAMASK